MQVKCTGETAHSPRREPPAARQHGIDRHSTCGRCELQRRHHEIEIEMDGVLNCLGCFLWVDLGTGAAATPGSEAEAAFNAAFDGGEQERTFPSTFPFGDPAFGPSATPEEEQQETVDARCNDFTSLCSRRTLRERRYASNWQNPLRNRFSGLIGLARTTQLIQIGTTKSFFLSLSRPNTYQSRSPRLHSETSLNGLLGVQRNSLPTLLLRSQRLTLL